jgi:radical SAM protein with 4Fe4S-binding SPASM domain
VLWLPDEIDSLVDWLIEKNKAGYQMVNSVPRLQEMKAFIRMASGSDLKRVGWNGDGTGRNGDVAKQIAGMPGIVQGSDGELRFAEWNCRAGQNNAIVRTDGTVAPCFPMYAATYDWGNIEHHKFDADDLRGMKKTTSAIAPTKAESRLAAPAGCAPSATTSLRWLGSTDWSIGTSW